MQYLAPERARRQTLKDTVVQLTWLFLSLSSPVADKEARLPGLSGAQDLPSQPSPREPLPLQWGAPDKGDILCFQGPQNTDFGECPILGPQNTVVVRQLKWWLAVRGHAVVSKFISSWAWEFCRACLWSLCKSS